MGLLDDAIREHLELKRRRGAEPGDIARVEREALEPDFGEEQAAWHGDLDAETDLPVDAFAGEDSGEMAAVGVTPVEDHPSESLEPAHDPDVSTVGQETAELDMRTVLDEDLETHADLSPVGPDAEPAGDGASSEPPPEDPLDREVPSREDPLEADVEAELGLQGEAAGRERQEHQERLSFE